MAGTLLGTKASFRKSKSGKLFHSVLFTEMSETRVVRKRNVPGLGLWEVRQDCLCWAEGLACLLAQVGLNDSLEELTSLLWL